MKIRKMTAPAVALTALSAILFAGCGGDTSGTDGASNTTSSTNTETMVKTDDAVKTDGAMKTDGAVKTVSVKEGFDVPAFDVLAVTGEQKGDTLCYV